MSLSIYQGLQSCLEPRIVEPRVLRIKLTPPPPPKSNSSQECVNGEKIQKTEKNTEPNSPDCENKKSVEKEKGGWSFLQSLTDSAIDDQTKVYVHPLVKQSSSSKLSKKSLEMCTESLGSETGSDNGSDYDNSKKTESTTRPRNYKNLQKNKKIIGKSQSQRQNFPPPLTSISGSNGVQMRPRREGGRLVLEAVKVSSRNTCLHAERSEGRLRISFSKEYSSPAPPPTAATAAGVENGMESEVEGKDGNNENVAAVRQMRCNEGGRNKSLLDWEPFWVAT